MLTMDDLTGQMFAVQRALEGIQRLDGDADRISYRIRASGVFVEGQNNTSELVFTVPKDFAFDAESLNLYTDMRDIDLQNNTQTERTYRPVDYSDRIPYGIAGGGGAFPYVQNSVDLVFSLRDSQHGNAQDYPCSVLAAFSGRVSTNSLIPGSPSVVEQSAMPVSGWAGCLKFYKPYHLGPGTTLTARITPVFSYNFGSAANRREYRVTGVLSGRKIVWRR